MGIQSNLNQHQKKAQITLSICGIVFMTLYFIATFNHLFDGHVYVMLTLVLTFSSISLFIALKNKLLNRKVLFFYAIVTILLITFRLYF